MLSIALFFTAFQSHAQISDFDSINFQKADRIALECKKDGLNTMPELVYKLTSQLTTDVEKFRAIYRWVCGNIANDYRLYEKNARKRLRFKNDSLKFNAWKDQFRKLSFQTLIKDQKTICTGYAFLVKEMARMANINCEVVNGYAKTSTIVVDTMSLPNHSWNAVELNGKWYLCDPTWASGTPNATDFHFEFNYNDGYFLTDPKLFALNHFPLDTKWLLLPDDEPTFDTFLEAPIIYSMAYSHLSSIESPKKMHNTVQKSEVITFKFQLLNSINPDDIMLTVDGGNSSINIRPNKTMIDNKSLTIQYAFERAGFYDVHLMIGLDLISTYTFRVKG